MTAKGTSSSGQAHPSGIPAAYDPGIAEPAWADYLSLPVAA